MAVSTSLKRASLEDAWDAAQAGERTLRVQLRLYETAARKTVSGGNLKSVSANGRSTVFQDGAQQADVVDLWRELIDLFDGSKRFLDRCATYGLNPAVTEPDGETGPLVAVDPPPASTTDQTVYDWMMDHLVPNYEVRSDFTELRTG